MLTGDCAVDSCHNQLSVDQLNLIWAKTHTDIGLLRHSEILTIVFVIIYIYLSFDFCCQLFVTQYPSLHLSTKWLCFVLEKLFHQHIG